MPVPTVTAPISLYRDPVIYEIERERIFARTWQLIGLEGDLARTGDYLADVVAGYPIMVVRDETGKTWGYHNVCRHRAGPLVGEAKGRCDREIVCRVHRWRYGFDGRLKEATGFGPAEDFDTSLFGLIPVRVETWRGLIFVNIDLEAAPLSDVTGPLEEKFDRISHRSARLRHRHPVACNWKVYVESFLDGFHLENEGGSTQPKVRLHGDVALHAEENAPADSLWAWVWPNLGVTIYRGVLLLEHMRPDGPDAMQIDHIFLHAPEDPGVDAAIHASEHVTEDRAWDCERVQQNLDAGVFRGGVLSPTQESATAWFQRRVLGVVGSAAVGDLQ